MQLVADAKALDAAGCFALVLEGVPDAVARMVTDSVDVPTIGIGAGPDCDGQVLVWQDAFGMRSGKMARFVKQYADVKSVLSDGAEAYISDVKGSTFPGPEHTF
jgi:3-methyl-2-oxobutanoate hydroxymethyltransferase